MISWIEKTYLFQLEFNSLIIVTNKLLVTHNLIYEEQFVFTGFEPVTFSKIVTNTMLVTHVSHNIVQVERTINSIELETISKL